MVRAYNLLIIAGFLLLIIALGLGASTPKPSITTAATLTEPKEVWVDDDDPTCGGKQPCFRTIQAAVDAAREGSTILIGPGLYKENVQIGKSLRLIGTGQDQTLIQAADQRHPIIQVMSKTPTQVYFQGFTLSDPNAAAEPPRLAHPGEFPMQYTGFFLAGPLQSILRQVTITGLKGVGLVAFSLMPGNFDPALLSFQPQTVLEEVKIIRNSIGVIGLSVYVSIIRSELFENIYGFMGDSLYMVNSTVRKNQDWGVDLRASPNFGPQHLGRLDENEISENGVGVILGTMSEEAAGSWLWMNGNKIVQNREYGLMVLKKACPTTLPHPELALGKESAFVQILGGYNEIIGNLKGDLCPPDYPWPPGFRK